jgi:hypothetical protein
MRAGGSRYIIYFSIIAAAALLFAACGKGRGGGGGASAPAAAAVVVPAVEAAPERGLAPLPVRELSPGLRAAGVRARADASRLRGLGWRREVGIAPLTSWELGARATALAGAYGAGDLQSLGRLAAAGGVIPEGSDPAALAATFTSISVGAIYSPLDQQVLVRADADQTAAAGKHSLLTHEFVHALQEQHFDVLGLLAARPYNFDRAEAAFALVEGDAASVQRRVEQGEVFARLSLEEIARAEDARFESLRRAAGWLFPAMLTETFVFRYRDGLHFVEAMRRARPAVGADDLFRRPPASTEQVLHPEKYLAQESPREVALDEGGFTNDGWRLDASTPLGEIGVRGLLLDRAPALEARRAAAGWGGDRAYLFARAGHAPLFVWQTVWDSPRDAREFFDAYNARWRRTGMRAPAGRSAGETPPLVWADGAAVVLVRIEGDAVTIIRGSEQDVHAALPLTKNAGP